MFQDSALADGHTHGAFVLEFDRCLYLYWLWSCRARVHCFTFMVMMVAVLTVGVLFIKGLPFDLWHNDMVNATKRNSR
jgi:hypothetical protein